MNFFKQVAYSIYPTLVGKLSAFLFCHEMLKLTVQYKLYGQTAIQVGSTNCLHEQCTIKTRALQSFTMQLSKKHFSVFIYCPLHTSGDD